MQWANQKRLLVGAARDRVTRLQYAVDSALRFESRLPHQLPLEPEQRAALFAAQSVCQSLLAAKVE